MYLRESIGSTPPINALPKQKKYIEVSVSLPIIDQPQNSAMAESV